MRRRLARQAALQMLFQIDLGKQTVEDALDWMRESVSLDPTMQEFATALVRGVCAHQREIDDLIEHYSVGWDLTRMAGVERNLLRLGIYEMFYCDEIPLPVTINEMVELGKSFGDANSGRFINGILGKIKTDIVASASPEEE
ncbi:MAG: transcription antitermination factor NusB [Firmicutes bacterium]|nr:transcription antitermination factor NusB [Bacillota bacterium]